MFAHVRTGLRGRQRRKSQSARPRSRWLAVERLEGREVPAAATGLPADFGGTVDKAHEMGWVPMQVETGSKPVLLAFEAAPAAGSALQAGPTRVYAGEGPSARRVGSTHGPGFALAAVRSGLHWAGVAGAGGTTGAFDVTVRLAGDVNNDGRVDAQDLDAIRGLRGVRAGAAGYMPVADVNHNGVIGIGDLRLARRNLGRSVEVGPVTADSFLFANSDSPGFAARGGPRAPFDPKTMHGLSLTMDTIAPDPLNPIDVDRASWGLKNPTDPDPATLYELQCEMPTSQASPLLFSAAASGQTIPAASLFLGRAGSQNPRVQWDMTAVQITSFYQDTAAGGGNNAILRDAITLSFQELKVTFNLVNPKGGGVTPIVRTWNFATNSGG